MTEPLAKDEPFLLKDLFDRKSVGAIGDAVQVALPAFDRPLFMDRVFDDGWSGPGAQAADAPRHHRAARR